MKFVAFIVRHSVVYLRVSISHFLGKLTESQCHQIYLETSTREGWLSAPLHRNCSVRVKVCFRPAVSVPLHPFIPKDIVNSRFGVNLKCPIDSVENAAMAKTAREKDER
jgi:hypothetical protein